MGPGRNLVTIHVLLYIEHFFKNEINLYFKTHESSVEKLKKIKYTIT